jgi:hypothetical protein
MMARKGRSVNLRLDDKAIGRLEMISFAHGGASWSSVVRSALLNLSVHLGIEKNEYPDDLCK